MTISNSNSKSTVIVAAVVILCSAMLAQAGTGLDTGFATTGKLVFRASPNANGSSFARAVAIDGNGRIVVAGSGYVQNTTTGGMAVARFNANGTPDTTFGAGAGFIVVPFTNGANFVESRVQAIGFQSDGKIILAGYATGFGVVTRLNSDGSLDSSFATNASFVSAFGQASAVLNSVYVLTDNSMYVAGVAGGKFLLSKLTSAGALDGTFGSGGITTTSFGGTANATSMAVNTTTGHIILGGYAQSSNNHSAVARYLSNGTLDTSFGSSGKVVTAVPTAQFDQISKTFVQPNGVITAIGLYVNPSGFERHMLLRFTPAGAADATFGTNGIAGGYFGNNQEFLYGGAALPDGKFIGVGFSAGTIGTRVSLFRYNANGSVDRSFGCSGRILATTLATSNTMTAYDVAVQTNGRVVAVGQGTNGSILQGNFSVFRFLNPSTPTQCAAADFDADGISDISVIRPNANGGGNAAWYRNNSTGFVNVNNPSADQFGLSTDEFAPADYDGDGRTDPAVFRDGTWYVLQSSTRTYRIAVFGTAGDLPIPGDFDGDGQADIAVFRPSTSDWYVLRSSDNQFRGQHWGATGDKPIVGDFDADHKADYTVWRPSTGTWYVLRSSDGQFQADAFGQLGDIPVAGDLNGTGKTDYAVFRPSNGFWYIARTTGIPAQNFDAIQFGQNGDVPSVGDYDGDGKADVALFRNGNWYIRASSNGQVIYAQFGIGGDIPVSTAF